MKTTALVLASLLTGGIAASAHATTPVQNLPQQVVSYADLDLQNAADAATLVRRIKSAARFVCGLRNPGPMPIDAQVLRQTCAKDATARALADVSERHGSEVRIAAIVRQ